MFAALNVMRLEVMEKLNLESMELSQNYPLFYDKLEKSNYFLENILETLDEHLKDGCLLICSATRFATADSGICLPAWWKSTELCRRDAMPESAASSQTAEMDRYLTRKLREFACTLREEHEAGQPEASLRRPQGGNAKYNLQNALHQPWHAAAKLYI